MNPKHNYHITPKGEVAVCRARVRPCPWAVASDSDMASKRDGHGVIQDAAIQTQWSKEEYKRLSSEYKHTNVYKFIDDPTVDPLTAFVQNEEQMGELGKSRRFEVVLDSFEEFGWHNEVRLEHNFFVNHLGQFENYTTLRGYRWKDSAVNPGETNMPHLINKIMDKGGPHVYSGDDKPRSFDYEMTEDIQLYVNKDTTSEFISSTDEGFTLSMEEAKKALESYYQKVSPEKDASKEAAIKTARISDIFKTIEMNRAPEKIWLDEKDLPDNGDRNPFHKTKSHDGDQLIMHVKHGSQYVNDKAFDDFVFRRDLSLDSPEFKLTLDNSSGIDMYQTSTNKPSQKGESGLSWRLDYNGSSWTLETTGADGYKTNYDIGKDGSGLSSALQSFSEDPYQLGGRNEGPPADQIPAEFKSVMGKNNYKMNSANAAIFIRDNNRRLAAYEGKRQAIIERREALRLKNAHKDLMNPARGVRFQEVPASNAKEESQEQQKKKGFFNTLNNLFT